VGQRLDVAVAGCGPAGVSTALFLARDGHRVTLFDQFAEPPPIGSGLMLQPQASSSFRGGYGSESCGGNSVGRLRGRITPMSFEYWNTRLAQGYARRAGKDVKRNVRLPKQDCIEFKGEGDIVEIHLKPKALEANMQSNAATLRHGALRFTSGVR
jgi:glycine/D-amino acid oxidase-like deaminating enzyme